MEISTSNFGAREDGGVSCAETGVNSANAMADDNRVAISFMGGTDHTISP